MAPDALATTSLAATTGGASAFPSAAPRNLVLHNYWRSSASYRVRLALALKDLTYEYRPVHLVRDGGQQHAEAYLAKNPMAQVPTLEIFEADGTNHTLTQSLAIIEYLDERWPTAPLLPRDPHARAFSRSVAEIINAGIQPLQNLAVTHKLKALGVDDRAWTQHFITKGLAAFDRALRDSPYSLCPSGTEEGAGGAFVQYCIGNAPTLADICLIPQLYSARRFGVDVAQWPWLQTIEAHCLALPAFAAAAPEQQMDAER